MWTPSQKRTSPTAANLATAQAIGARRRNPAAKRWRSLSRCTVFRREVVQRLAGSAFHDSPMIFFAACLVSVPAFAKRSARSIKRQTSRAFARSVYLVDFLSRWPSALV